MCKILLTFMRLPGKFQLYKGSLFYRSYMEQAR
jgi:hypothetical protein